MTVNEQLRDAAIEHQHYVEQYVNHQQLKYQAMLEEADKALFKIIAEYSGIDNWTEARQKRMLKEIAESEQIFRTKFDAEYKADLKDFAETEAAWQAKQFGAAMAEYGAFNIETVTAGFLMKSAKDQLLLLDNSETLSLYDYIGRMFPGRGEVITQTLQQGFVLGKTAGDMTRQLFGTEKFDYGDASMAKARNWLNGMVRTTMTHTGNVARMEMYEANDDIIKGYQVIATLDGRTSPKCIDYDHRIWLFSGKSMPGARMLPGPVKPPFHRRCRSTTTPLVKSWKELGLDLEEMPEGTRSGLSGYVPESFTYLDWLKGAGDYRQKEVLGVTRYNAWKNGEIKIEKFFQDGKMLTLKELKLK